MPDSAQRRAATPGGPLPWATVSIGLAALLAAAVDRAGPTWMIYVRERILAGEIWRLWTAHAAHFGLSHLGWNLLVLIPMGAWAERILPWRTRLFYAFAPIFIGAALLVLDSSLHRYGGLSGLATGVVVLLGLAQFSGKPGCDRWIGWGLLGAVAAKIVLETATGHAPFASLPDGEIRPVPLAHIVGAMSAAVMHFGWRAAKSRM